ncbi:MAG: DsbA family protein [Gammaproteobacteria bacterium]
MSTATLHYIYDPLCGWCYGAAPLVKAAREIEGLRFVLHGGGMMAGSARQLASEGLRQFVMQHAARITAMTGQPFGEPYTNGLLRDHTAMLDSEPPTAAVLAVEAAAGRGADMAAHLQKAHFVEGRALSDRAALAALAADLGVDRAVFDAEFSKALGTAVQAHMTESRRLLSRVGGQGFPTFALETPRGLAMLDSSRWLGKPAEWRKALEATLAG